MDEKGVKQAEVFRPNQQDSLCPVDLIVDGCGKTEARTWSEARGITSARALSKYSTFELPMEVASSGFGSAKLACVCQG